VAGHFVSNFVLVLCQALALAVFARAILSWIPVLRPGSPLVGVLVDLTEPILAPLRRVIPRIGALDLSPLVAMILLRQIGPILAAGIRGVGL
jgi:YggT family protein